MIRLTIQYYEGGSETSHSHITFDNLNETWNWVRAHYPELETVPTFKHAVKTGFIDSSESVRLSVRRE